MPSKTAWLGKCIDLSKQAAKDRHTSSHGAREGALRLLPLRLMQKGRRSAWAAHHGATILRLVGVIMRLQDTKNDTVNLTGSLCTFQPRLQ